MPEPEFRWTQDEWIDRESGASLSPVRAFLDQHGWVVRGVIVGLGMLVFELTADAAIATAVGCLELGRSDFQTARWLRKTDPDRQRGRICARCYSAWAFLRVGLLSLAIMFVITMMADLPRGQNPIETIPHIQGAAALMLFAFLTAVWQSFVVTISAFLARQPIWLGPEPRWARRQGVWPPSAATRSKRTTNQAKVIFYLGMMFLAGPTVLAAILSLGAHPAAPPLFFGLLMLVLIGFAIGMPRLERRVLARTPDDCWPCDLADRPQHQESLRDGRIRATMDPG